MHATRTHLTNTIASLLIGMAVGLPMNCDHGSHGSHGSGSHDHGADAQGPLALNAGKRWPADAPTRSGMRALKQKVDTFEAGRKKTAKDEAALRAEIEADVGAIVKSCTMTGPGHTELHKYIALLLKDAKSLGTGDASAGPARVKKVQEDILLFDKYFE